ncbi:MAG: helix-turn-helix domain-containing protein [Cetobacterium sp.]
MHNKIKLILDSRNISPYQMAKDVGITQKTAYDLYNRPSQIPFGKVLEKICIAYGLMPNDVLGIDFGIPGVLEGD